VKLYRCFCASKRIFGYSIRLLVDFGSCVYAKHLIGRRFSDVRFIKQSHTLTSLILHG